MKNRLFLAFVVLFCLFFTTHVGYAQSTNAETSDTDAKISFSDTYENKDVSKDKSKVVMSRFLFKDTLGNIYALKMLERENFSSDKVYIEKYTPDLKQVFDKELPLASVGGSLRYDAVLMLKGQIYVLADCRNPTTYFVYAIKINNDGQADTPIRLAEFASGSSKGRCTIKISKDSSKIMVSPLLLHEKVNGRKSTLDDVSVLVFDNNLKLLWKKETTTLRKVKTYGIASPPIQREITANFGVDSKGQILTVARLKSDKKGDDNLLPHLCISDARGGNKNFPLDLNQKEVLAFDFLETTDPDQLIILGTYSVRTHDGYFDKKPEANGTFFIRIDTQTGIIVSQSVNPFSQEIYKFLDINNRKQENGEGITNLELTNYTTTSKNNIILVIEESVNTVFHSNVSDYPFHASSTMFNIKYNADGKILYQNYIPRNLTSTNAYGMDDTQIIHDEQYAFLFNDHKKNIGKTFKTTSNIKGATPGNDPTVIRLVTVDKNGEQKTSVIEDNFVLQTTATLQYAPNIFITVGVSKAKFKLIKVTY